MKVKMVWKFSGEGALKTAQHHLVHLKEYTVIENIAVLEFGTEQLTEFTARAFMIVQEEFVNDLRKRLNPHQGFMVE